MGQVSRIFQLNGQMSTWSMLGERLNVLFMDFLDYLSYNFNFINPLHPNISIDVLHTVLYAFPKVLIRRICLTIKSFLILQSFPFFW